MAKFFTSAKVFGNEVGTPLPTPLGRFEKQPASLIDLIEDPETPSKPIADFEVDMVRELLHKQDDSWNLIKHYEWEKGGFLEVKRHSDTSIFGGVLFGRFRCFLPDVSLAAVSYSIFNFKERSKWDSQLISQEMFETGDGDPYGSDVAYFQISLSPLSTRDFLVYQAIRPLPNGATFVYNRQATNELRPHVASKVRGKVICNAFELMERPGGGVDMVFVSCLDLQLPLSAWLVMFFLPAQMRVWFRGLEAHAAKHGDSPPLPCKLTPPTEDAQAGMPKEEAERKREALAEASRAAKPADEGELTVPADEAEPNAEAEGLPPTIMNVRLPTSLGALHQGDTKAVVAGTRSCGTSPSDASTKAPSDQDICVDDSSRSTGCGLSLSSFWLF